MQRLNIDFRRFRSFLENRRPIIIDSFSWCTDQYFFPQLYKPSSRCTIDFLWTPSRVHERSIPKPAHFTLQPILKYTLRHELGNCSAIKSKFIHKLSHNVAQNYHAEFHDTCLSPFVHFKKLNDMNHERKNPRTTRLCPPPCVL